MPGVLPVLVDLVVNGTSNLQEQAVAALLSLAIDCDENNVAISNVPGALEALLALVREEGKEKAAAHAAAALGILACNNDIKRPSTSWRARGRRW